MYILSVFAFTFRQYYKLNMLVVHLCHYFHIVIIALLDIINDTYSMNIIKGLVQHDCNAFNCTKVMKSPLYPVGSTTCL